MTQPLARPTRFPRGPEKWDLVEILDWGRRQAAKKPWNDLERLLRVLQLTYGISRAEALARARLEYPTLAKEATMTTTEYVEYTTEEIEAEVVARTHAYILERNLDPEKDYRTAHHAVLDADPSLKLAYFAGVGGPVTGPGLVRPLDPLNRPADVQGPQSQPVAVPDRLLEKKIQDYRGRYPEVADATTRFDFFRLFLKGLTREDPVHTRDNYWRAQITDPELAALGAQGGA